MISWRKALESHRAITEVSEGCASNATIMGITGHVSHKMLGHYSHTRIAAKHKALESLGETSHDTVTTQNLLFKEDKKGRNSLKTLVDETGIEPATSSLRTVGKIS